MRLIDADKLKEFLNGVKKESRDCTTKEFLEITDGIIDKQPTAFDVDKVAEQLEGKGRWEDIEDNLPDPGQYVLASFENETLTLPTIARYEVDENGNGAFFPDDSDVAFVSVGIYVNAWMPLPKLYRKEENNE